MDFQSLSRKDLQTLCKKNKIPANITNVAMAEALAALQEVAGIEEFLNPIESESQQSEERIDNGSPGNSRTACRTSTSRKPVKEEPPTTQSIIRTRRGRVGEMADQENKDLNISSTPSFPSNRRRAPVPSARKKLETQLIEGKEKEKDQNNGDQKRSDVLETPSMPKTQRKVSELGSTRRKTEARMDKSSVQGACSTRRSMRLLEKNMEKLSLMECGSVEPVVADRLFDELPERKGFCEQKINEIDSKLNVFAIGGNAFEEDDSKETLGLVDESDDPEGMNETNDGKEKEKVEMEDKNEEENTMTDKEPQDKIQSEAAIKDQCEPEDKFQSEAAIEEQHASTPSCNDEYLTENFSKESDLAAQSPLIQDKANLDITTQHEVLKEDSEIITEETVEFNSEDLVDIHVKEAEFLEASCQTCNVNAQDSISEAKMEVQVLSDGFNIEDLVDIHVKDAEFLEASCQTCNVNAQDSISEPKMEVQVLSDGDYFIKKMVEFKFGELIDVNVMEAEMVENSIQEPYHFEEQVNNFNSKDLFPEPKMEDLVVIQELPYEENSGVIDNSSTPFAVDQIPVQFPRPTAAVSVKESITSLKICNSENQDEDMKNNSNDDEERNLSLRQLRKMIKELHLSKKSNKEKTYGEEQVEKKVVRTALQPLSENCMAQDGQVKTTTENSMLF